MKLVFLLYLISFNFYAHASKCPRHSMAKEVLSHPDWYKPYATDEDSALWNRLYKGGCGTLTAYVIASKKDKGIDPYDVDEYFNHQVGTTSEQRLDFYQSQDFLILFKNKNLKRNLEDCSLMKSLKDLRCEIDLMMVSKSKHRHSEYLHNVSHSNGFCYAITNYWGKAGLLYWSEKNFYHGSLKKYSDAEISINVLCPLNDDVVSYAKNHVLDLETEENFEESLRISKSLSEKVDLQEWGLQRALKGRDIASYQFELDVGSILANVYKTHPELVSPYIKDETFFPLSKGMFFAEAIHLKGIREEAQAFVNRMKSTAMYWYEKEPVLRIGLKLLQLEKIPQPTLYELALKELFSESYSNRTLALKIIIQQYQIAKSDKFLEDLRLVLLEYIKMYLISTYEAEALVELTREFIGNRELDDVVLKIIDNIEKTFPKYPFGLSLIRELVIQNKNFELAYDSVQENAYSSIEEVEIGGLLVLNELIKKQYQPAIDFAKGYLKSEKSKYPYMGYYQQELEKSLLALGVNLETELSETGLERMTRVIGETLLSFIPSLSLFIPFPSPFLFP